MKQILFLIALFLIFWSCKTTTKKTDKAIEKLESFKQEYGKKFFEYDAIDYYQNDFDESKVGELYSNELKTEFSTLKKEIILGDIPKNITDLSFIRKLEKVGYKKSYINKSKFQSIDKIFIEKKASENLSTACVYVYRDILIFRKEGKVVGTSKICFECMANQINGTTANTENFGQDGDYEELSKILRQ